MPEIMISNELIKRTIEFHGHWCPGLAIGIRASDMALKEMGKAADEEIVAVVETDMCGVDAVQFLTGCTFGKGNLIHKDYGKNAFTFFRRRDQKAFRIVTKPSIFDETREHIRALQKKQSEEGSLTKEEARMLEEAREDLKKKIMEAAIEDIFEMKPVVDPIPNQARILSSLTCDSCNEATMETRIRVLHGRHLCIPCFETQLQAG